MITNKWKKLIKSLHSKKHRKNSGLFLVEGEKVFFELLNSDFEIVYAVVSDKVAEGIPSDRQIEFTVGTDDEIGGLSTLKNNYSALAVVRMKEMPVNTEVGFDFQQPLSLVLDSIQDPGNLGTIIRTADWYGIKQVICSSNCVDFYSPKVISATMGSFCRIQPVYTDLEAFLQQASGKLNILGAYMEGKSVHQLSASGKNLLVMGNESNGISASLSRYITTKISVPGGGNAESLNVAIATSILCDNIYRQIG